MEATTILTSSLIAAVISAGVSAWMSLVLKNKDYRNDYYKKVIDKRLKAAEALEALLALFASVTTINGSEGVIYVFFIKNHHSYKEEFMSENDNFSKLAESVAGQTMWLSRDCVKLLKEFSSMVSAVRYEVDKIAQGYVIMDYYANKHNDIARAKRLLEISLADDMAHLYDVEAFFRLRKKGL